MLVELVQPQPTLPPTALPTQGCKGTESEEALGMTMIPKASNIFHSLN
jgi:hypothetical protein